MPLTAGTRLGPYEVLSKVGEGGMGEVYRARDTRLDRDVAIKVLPASLAADTEALARFEREAKAIAALSHPNILALHDFGAAGGIAYAVTELLSGKTLRERLADGPLSVKKIAQIGTEVANGLAAAHERGIVHRDLKPENIFVTTDGHVKILDFGLARQVGASAGGPSDSPTMLHTNPGTVMGTVGYMSPEQVKGHPVDARSDIFSFGCVLYEMATGRRAFERSTAAETITAILRDEPAELPHELSTASIALDQIVRHCLEKQPDERFQSARDLAFALQSLAEMRQAAPASGPSPVVSLTRSRATTPARLGVATLALLLIAGAFVGGRFSARTGNGALPTAPALSFQQVTDQAGVESWPSLSPDGKSVVYVSDAAGRPDLYLLRIGARVPTRLTADSPAPSSDPAFSPDGEHIAFRSGRDGGGIYVMTATGESVTRLSDIGFSPTWSPDGNEIAVASSGFSYPQDRGGSAPGLWAIQVKSDKRRAISEKLIALQPAWSPHGQRIAFWALRGNTGQRDILTIAADGSEGDAGVTVTEDAALDWSPTWSADGAFLYFSSNRGGTMNLWRVPIDERSGRVLGEPEPVTTPSIYSGNMSISRDGSRMVFSSVDWRSTLYRVGFDPARDALVGTPAPILKSTRPIRDHNVSPDGAWVVFMESGVQEDLFVARTDGTQYRRLTDDAFRDRAPTWSPSGQSITFYSDRGGKYDMWSIRPDGMGLEQLTAVGAVNFAVWSPDGSRLALSGVGMGGWFFADPQAKRAITLALQPAPDPAETFWPVTWSPDGTRIAGPGVRSDGSVTSLHVFTLASNTFARVPGDVATTQGFLTPAWVGNTSKLIVRRADGISIVRTDTGERKMVIPVRGYSIGLSVGVSRDGRWIMYTETGTEGDIWMANLRK